MIAAITSTNKKWCIHVCIGCLRCIFESLVYIPNINIIAIQMVLIVFLILKQQWCWWLLLYVLYINRNKLWSYIMHSIGYPQCLCPRLVSKEEKKYIRGDVCFRILILYLFPYQHYCNIFYYWNCPNLPEWTGIL